MKKHLIYFASAISIFSTTLIAQNRSIAFEHGSFKEIKEKALKENKLIFIDAYTTWCGPCKQMAKNIFTNDTVADYYNKNFVNAKIDMEKGEGIEIAKMYEVSCYPNLLFIDGNGNLVHRDAGSMPVSSFMVFAETAQNPEKRFSYFVKNYDANKQNSEFLIKYIEKASSSCLTPTGAISQYFSLQKDEDLLSQSNWEMILEHTNSMDSREFKYVMSNKDKFEKAYTPVAVNDKINNITRSALKSVVKSTPFNELKYKEAKDKITTLNLSSTKLVFFESDLSLSQKKSDWDLYAKLAVENVDLFYSNDPNMLNNIAWNFYEKVTNKEALLKAESWAMKACEIENTYANKDTYAAVLYKVGKKDLALTTANNAIELAKKEKYTAEDYKGTTELIEKIKALK